MSRGSGPTRPANPRPTSPPSPKRPTWVGLLLADRPQPKPPGPKPPTRLVTAMSHTPPPTDPGNGKPKPNPTPGRLLLTTPRVLLAEDGIRRNAIPPRHRSGRACAGMIATAPVLLLLGLARAGLAEWQLRLDGAR